MSTTIVRAIKASQADVTSGPLEAWGQRPGATGEAATRGKKLLEREDLPQVGIWDCTPGSWTVTDRQDTEIELIVAGRGRITDADGEAYELGPGDVIVLPVGWSGRWEILEPLRKVYVVVPG